MSDDVTTPHIGQRSREDLETWMAGTPDPNELQRADLSGVCLTGLRFERLVFGSHSPESGLPVARLDKAAFRECTFVRCEFAHVECVDTDFRRAYFVNCDFRYASFNGGTFAEAILVDCDFYRAQFEKGVVFNEDTIVRRVSLDKASLGGIIGLDSESFGKRGAISLLQEDKERYAAVVRSTSGNSLRNENEGLEKRRLGEARVTYRALSGLWSGQGLFADAAWAYLRAKHFERKLAWRNGDFLRWLGLALANLLCRFGERLWPVLVWIVVLAAGPGLAYRILGGVELEGVRDATLWDCMLFSAATLTASTPERLSAANATVEWIGVAQTFLGIALLGLLGFVLGNKLRTS